VPGLVQRAVPNVQNGFEDGCCTPSTAGGVHFGCHADIWQPSTHLKRSFHRIQHKTTHTQRSNPRRYRTHLGRGPKRISIAVPGLVQSGVLNVQNGFEDGWCIPSTIAGVHFGFHADI
jgi:hypothetical protein